MAPLSFVYSDGTAECDSLNRRIVRSHVSKHFHPKKNGQQFQQLGHIGRSEPRLIAPNHPPLYPIGESTHIFVDNRDDDAEEQTLPIRAQNNKASSRHPSPASHIDSFSFEDDLSDGPADNLKPQKDESSSQIESNAVMGLVRSGASKEKNIRIAWLKEGRITKHVAFCELALITLQ